MKLGGVYALPLQSRNQGDPHILAS